MITGDGTTAQYTAEFYGDVPWLWICDDIDYMDDGEPAYGFLFELIRNRIIESDLEDVVISSQVLVGTTRRLEELFPERRFAYMPENYRVASRRRPEKPDYWICGTRSEDLWKQINIAIWLEDRMSPESAEMVKHATNAFLALQIEFAHELAVIAQDRGASAAEVANGLRADPRIGTQAYLRPYGEPSVHLLREVRTLAGLGGGKLIDVIA